MEIKISNNNEVKNVYLIGNLDGNSSPEVTEKITSLIQENMKIVIDMEKCGYVSSAGLRALLTIGKFLKMKSGHMKIINICEEVEDVMEMTGFSTIFKGFEN